MRQKLGHTKDYQCGGLNQGAILLNEYNQNVCNYQLSSSTNQAVIFLVSQIWINVDAVFTKPIIGCNITYWIRDFTKDSQYTSATHVHSEGIRGEKKSGLQNRNLYSKIGSISFCGLLRRRFTMAEISNFASNILNCKVVIL